jgi:hypothetical protein
VYGGKFSTGASNCTAPTPIMISSNDANGVKLSWTATENADSYSVYASTTADFTDVTPQIITGTTVTLVALGSGASYLVKIDATCASSSATGTPQTITANQTGVAGSCPLPKPASLLVERPLTKTNAFDANVTWMRATDPLYQSYDFTYWPADTATQKLTKNSLLPSTSIEKIYDNKLYAYQIKYFCSATNSVVSKQGMFRLEPSSTTDPGIIPNTANCFPPAIISAEPRDETSANFEWDKVKDASEYQLFYAPMGSSDFKSFNTTSDNAKVKDLVDAGKIYDYKVRCRCGTNYSIFSAVGQVDLTKAPATGVCDTIPFVSVLKTTNAEIQLTWKYEIARSGYTIFYKEDSQKWSEQYTIDLKDIATLTLKNLTKSADSVRYTVDNLKSGVTYQFKVQAWCGIAQAQINDIVTGTTTTSPAKGNCESGSSCDRSSTVGIAPTEMIIGKTIEIADYTMEIVTINTSVDATGKTVYSGTGIAEMPFIGMSDNIQMNTTFTNIFVNDKV